MDSWLLLEISKTSLDSFFIIFWTSGPSWANFLEVDTLSLFVSTFGKSIPKFVALSYSPDLSKGLLISFSVLFSSTLYGDNCFCSSLVNTLSTLNNFCEWCYFIMDSTHVNNFIAPFVKYVKSVNRGLFCSINDKTLNIWSSVNSETFNVTNSVLNVGLLSKSLAST